MTRSKLWVLKVGSKNGEGKTKKKKAHILGPSKKETKVFEKGKLNKIKIPTAKSCPENGLK